MSHDPSAIILICWFADKVTINAENSHAAYYHCENWDTFLGGILDEYKVQKNSYF